MAPGGDEEVSAGETHVKNMGVGCSIENTYFLLNFFFHIKLGCSFKFSFLKLKLDYVEDTQKNPVKVFEY